MNKKIVITALVIIFLIGGYIFSQKKDPQVIGGDRDTHGCLAPAGYTFNEEIGACARSFELTPDIANAARLAVLKGGGGYGVTVVSFNSYEDQTYDITLEYGVERTRKVFRIVSGQATESFRTINKEAYSGIDEKRKAVIKSETEWATLWSEINARVMPKPSVPKIDFSKEIVLGVFMGEKSTGGYGIEITGISESESKITVTVKETSPGQNCAVTTAITNPYHVVAIQKSTKQIEFSVTKEVVDCVEN